MSGAANAGGAGRDSSITAELSVTFVDLDAMRPFLFSVETALPRLSPGDRARAERRNGNLDDAERWRAARIATRIVLERFAGAAVRNVDFVIADGGRPELPPGFPFFSVSHSGAAALVAVSCAAPIGVDIEAERTLSMSLERRQRLIVAAGSVDNGGDALDPLRDGDVLRAWVRLEAVAKALGSGIGRLLTVRRVVANATGAEVRGDQAADPRVTDLSVPNGFVAALATATVRSGVVDVSGFPADAEALARYLSD